MSANDDLAKQAISTLLNSADLQKIKAFTISSFKLDPLLLKNVANAVASGDIKVQYDSVKYQGWAEYDSDSNTFFVGFTSPDLTKKGLIVHEATHAYFDMKNAAGMKVVDSESAAFLAQCEFVRANSSDPTQRLMSDNANRDKVFEVGWDLAGKLLGGTTPSAADFDKLRDAVRHHPFYTDNNDKLAGFNGVPTSWKTLSSDSSKANVWPITYEEIPKSKHFQVLPQSSVANGTLSVLKPTNSGAILRVTTQSDGTLTLENTTLGNTVVAVIAPSTLITGGYRLVSGSLADSLSDDFGTWRSKNRKPKLDDLVFPQLHLK
jgi:hypothetical protein